MVKYISYNAGGGIKQSRLYLMCYLLTGIYDTSCFTNIKEKKKTCFFKIKMKTIYVLFIGGNEREDSRWGTNKPNHTKEKKRQRRRRAKQTSTLFIGLNT